MAALILVAVLLLAAVFSIVGEGADLGDRDRRGWWPGSSRR